jgi:hypothetical protein
MRPFRRIYKIPPLAKLLAISLLFIGASPDFIAQASDQHEVRAVVSGSVDQIPDAELRNFLRDNEIDPAPSTLGPWVGKATENIARILPKYFLPGENHSHVDVILVDDMTVNAGYARLPSGKEVIFLNLGILDLVKNDHQLGFVLSHELTHGKSSVEEYLERRELDRGGSHHDDEENGYRSLLFRRGEEFEADIRGAIERMVHAGQSPHAAYDFLDSLAKRTGENIAWSHPSTEARRDAVGLGTAYAVREKGRDINDRLGTMRQEDTIVAPIHAVLNSSPFRERELGEIKKILTVSPDVGDQVHGQVFEPINFDQRADTYEQAFAKQKKKLHAYGEKLLPWGDPKKMVAIELALHRGLSRSVDEARDAEIENAAFKTPGDVFVRLKHEERAYPISAPDILSMHLAIRNTKKQIAEFPGKLAFYKAKGNAPEWIAKEEQRHQESIENLAEYEKKYEAAKAYYPDPETIDQRVEQFGKGYLGELGGTRSPSFDYHPEKLLGPRLLPKGLEELVARQWDWRKSFIRSHLNTLMQADGLEENERYVAPLIAEAHVEPRFLYQYLMNYGVMVDADLPERVGYYQIKLPGSGYQRASIREMFAQLAGQNKKMAENAANLVVEANLRRASDLITLESMSLSTIMPDRSFPGEIGRSPQSLKLVRDSSWPLLRKGLADAAEPKDVFQLASSFEKIVNYLGDQKEWRDSSALRARLAQPLGEALQRTLAKMHVTVSESTAKDLLLYSNPRIFAKGEKLSPEERDRVRRGFEAVLAVPGAARSLPEFFDLNQLAEVLYDPSNPAPFYELMLKATGMLKNGDTRENASFGISQRQQMGEWLLAHHPEASDLAEVVLSTDTRDYSLTAEGITRAKQMSHLRKEIEKARFRQIFTAQKDFPEKQRETESYYRYFMEKFTRVGRAGDASELQSLPAKPQDLLQRFINIQDAAHRSARVLSVHGYNSDFDDRFDLDKLRELAKNRNALDQIDPEILINAYRKLCKMDGRTWGRDEGTWEPLFESVWDRLKKSPPDHPPSWVGILKDPSLVGDLAFEKNKIELAHWQIEKQLGISEIAKIERKRMVPPSKTEFREQVKKSYTLIRQQFPKESTARHEVAGWVQDKFITNEPETKLLSRLRINPENWAESALLGIGDANQLVKNLGETPSEKFQWLEYVVGVKKDPPSEIDKDDSADVLKVRRALRESRREVQSYIIMPFLDENDGILSSPESTEALTHLVLGEARETPALAKAMKTYLSILTIGERKSLYSYILSGIAKDPEKGSSLNVVLDGFGVFGAKAKQGLRTSGYLPPELRAQLDGAFDRVQPPDRGEIFTKMKKLFGGELKEVVSVRQLAGSGSINYGVVVDLKDPRDPAGKKFRRVLVRVVKEGIEGRAKNENEALVATTTKLMTDEDPSVRRLGKLIEEMRRHSYQTIGPDGAELNLAVERNIHADLMADKRAGKAIPYESRKDKGGYSIELVKPLPEFHDQIERFNESTGEQVSIYDFIDNVGLQDLPSDKERQKVSKRIVQSELDALFKFGAFDPDGHPGNWLIDQKQGRLVRIDYGQFRKISPERLKPLRETFATLLLPRPTAGAKKTLYDNLRLFFEIPGQTTRVSDELWKNAVDDILSSPDLPSFRAPHERLLFLQGELEKKLALELNQPDLSVQMSPELTAAVSSLGRINYYDEHLPASEFGKMFVQSVGANPVKIALQNFTQGVRRTVSTIMNCIIQKFRGFAGP